MSLGTRLTLRPVNWAEVNAHGQLRRRKRSPATPQSTGSSSSSNNHDDASDEPAKKKKKSVGLPALYYPPALSPSEKIWRDRSPYLLQKGYQTRPRYQSNWTPTCQGNSRHHHSGEDHIMQILPQVLDAIRREDGLVVCIKMMQNPQKIKQIKVLEYFSSRKMSDSRNHVVPLLDAFRDTYISHIHYMVMPVLRRFDDPEFKLCSDVADFVTQVLEGLAFLHENNIAHHNLNAEHIMMDAKSIIPTGWHFVSHFCEPDGMTKITPLSRKSHPVRYYFVGFGSCFHIPPNHPPLVRDIGGNDDDVPELFTGKAYDAFKLDIYTLGNVLLKEIFNRYNGTDFIYPIINYMRIPEFENRPSAAYVLGEWYRIRHDLDETELENTRLWAQGTPQPPSPTTDPDSTDGT